MALWIRLASVYNGLLAFFDLFIFSYYAFALKGSPLELGVINASWSLAYIVANLALGRLADAGGNKRLSTLSLIFSAMTALAFLNNTKLSVAISYVFHALAMTAHNLSTSVSILELVDSTRWHRLNVELRMGTHVSRGLFLIMLSLTYGETGLSYYLYLLLALALLQAILLPSIAFPLERGIYRLMSSIDEIVHRASSWGLLSSSINPSSLMLVARRELKRDDTLAPGRILLLILMISALGDYVFISFTYRLAHMLPYSSYLLFMGAVSVVVSPMLLLVSNVFTGSRLFLLSLIFLRGAFFLAFLPSVNSPLDGAIFILIANITFAGIEVGLYSMYVSATSGYRGNLFFISRELGCIIGSILGGLVWRNAQFAYQYVIVIFIALSLLLGLRGRGEGWQ